MLLRADTKSRSCHPPERARGAGTVATSGSMIASPSSGLRTRLRDQPDPGRATAARLAPTPFGGQHPKNPEETARPSALRTAGTWEGGRVGNNLPADWPFQRQRIPPAPRRPTGESAPCRPGHHSAASMPLDPPTAGCRCRHQSTLRWQCQHSRSTSPRRSRPSRAYVRWCTVTVAGPPPCRTNRRRQRAHRRSLVTNHHHRRARHNGEPTYSSYRSEWRPPSFMNRPFAAAHR